MITTKNTIINSIEQIPVTKKSTPILCFEIYVDPTDPTSELCAMYQTIAVYDEMVPSRFHGADWLFTTWKLPAYMDGNFAVELICRRWGIKVCEPGGAVHIDLDKSDEIINWAMTVIEGIDDFPLDDEGQYEAIQ